MNLPKKIICLFLIVTLICNPVATYAQAGTLTVSGGSTVGGIAVATTLCMMVAQSLGFTFHLAKTATDAGKEVSDWLEDELNDWLKNLDATEIEMMTGGGSGGGDSGNNNNSNKIGPDGKIYIGAGALYMIQKFFNWLKGRGKLKPSSSSATIVCGTLYATSITAVDSTGNAVYMYASDNNKNATGKNLCWVSLYDTNKHAYRLKAFYMDDIDQMDDTNRVTVVNGSSSYISYLTNRSNFTYDNNQVIIHEGPIMRYGNWVYFSQLPEGVANVGTTQENAYFDVKSFVMENYDNNIESSDESYIQGSYDDSVLNNPDGKYMVIDPRILLSLQSQIAENTNATIGVQEYLKAIQNSLNQKGGSQPESVNARDNDTLGNVPLTVPEPEPYTPVLPSDQVDPESTVDPPEESTPVSVPPETAPPSETVPLMLFPLKDYFPFCIPWDIYDIFSKFIGDPVAPNFTVTLPNPGDNSTVQVEIDLAMFDDMMAVIRKAELMAFVVGLAIATKDIYTK